MRTEHGKNYIESERVPPVADDPDNCAFCKRSPTEDVRRVEASRNGRQTLLVVNICGPCRLDLIHHLSAR